MKYIKKLLMVITTLMLVVAPLHVSAEEYTYTVRLYAGDLGTFNGQAYIEYTGLTYGQRISLDADAHTATLNSDASQYYIRGVRESGKDNNTIDNGSFVVTSDREYVVAYGIKGEMVSYTINYVDVNGNALANSQTYYGKVGDKPVVAYLYVDGYQPQAYNLTKTLSSNEADNVFTFTYTAKPTSTETIIDEGTTNNGSTTNRTTGTTTNNGTTTDNNTATGDNSNSEVTDDNNNTATDENSGEESNVDENGTQDIVDLDDNDTPLENINADDSNDTDKNMLVYIGVAVVAIAALVGFLFFVFKKKKKEDKQ